MTEQEFEEFMDNHPTLYHMAEHGSWPSIKAHGLLSTSALLDLYSIPSDERKKIEEKHRTKSVRIVTRREFDIQVETEDAERVLIEEKITIRDQKMDDQSLKRCLLDSLKPRDWYQTLNHKCFFWVTEDALHRLTGARDYQGRAHDVLEIDTRSLVEAHRDKIRLCSINSGFTLLKWGKLPLRGKSTFKTIDKHPYNEPVVELTVEYAVPDIREHVKRVIEKQRNNRISTIWQREDI